MTAHKESASRIWTAQMSAILTERCRRLVMAAHLIVRTTGNITATADTIIIARTGLTPPDIPFGGAGGHVTLDSSAGLVSFDGLIRVSAYAPFESHGDPQRRSASGGFITLHSGLTSGMAIEVGNNALLQALLGDDAPGPGGLIQLVSEGGDIVVNGQLEADRGNILITNLGFPAGPHGNTSTGSITLDGSGFTASTFEIASGRDLNIGLNTSVDFNANSALTLSAANALRFGDFVSTSFVTDVIGDVMISAGSVTANSILIDRHQRWSVAGHQYFDASGKQYYRRKRLPDCRPTIPSATSVMALTSL